MILCLTSKANFAVILNILSNEIHVQSLKPSPRSTVKIEGMTTLIFNEKQVIMLLLDDGSLYRYDIRKNPKVYHIKSSKDIDIASLIKKKQEKGLIESKAIFDITFFEKVECITHSVIFGGDILQSYTSDIAKQHLATNDEYIVSPFKDCFKIVIQNTKNDMIMVGVRVLLGSFSSLNIPRELRIFNRTIQVTDNMR